MKFRTRLGRNFQLPAPREYPEVEGVVLQDRDKLVLACPEDWHKVGTIHDGHVLKIRDRRCKKDLTFDLSRVESLSSMKNGKEDGAK